MKAKIPFLRGEYCSEFSTAFLEMPREELNQKMPIVDIEHTQESKGAPIRFYTTIRSLYTNKVLFKQDLSQFYFESFPCCNEFNTLAELSILAAKDTLGKFIDLNKEEVKAIVASTTQPYPAFVGVVCDTPIVYMNVLCKDSWATSKDFNDEWLIRDSEQIKWGSIEDLKCLLPTFGEVSKKLYGSLKICKRESEGNNA